MQPLISFADSSPGEPFPQEGNIYPDFIRTFY